MTQAPPVHATQGDYLHHQRHASILLKCGLAAIALAALLIAALLVSHNNYYASVAFNICFWAVVACAYNLSSGYAGDLSLGHGAFLGMGAYTSTLLFEKAHLSPWLGLVVGAALAAVLALVLGVIAVRLRGPYFAIVTLAIVLVLNLFAAGEPSLTKGDSGISIGGNVSVGNLLFRNPATYVGIAFALLVLVIIFCRFVVRSRLGYQLAAYRENEDAARSLGIATTRVRVVALIASAAITAVAGSLQAQYIQFVSPDSEFSLSFSVKVALVAIVGGLATIYGPVFGAALIVILGELLAPLVQHLAGLDQVVYGAIMIVVLLFFKRGLAGLGPLTRDALRTVRTHQQTRAGR